jgi:putative ABC transport system permease protein
MAFAISALNENKLRTFLSQMGITVGIFAIISVLTVVDSLERNIRSSVQSLGDNTVYVQKWPWGGGGGEYEWWEYWRWPSPRYDEMIKLEKRLTTAKAVAFGASMSTTVKYLSNTIENVGMFGVSHGYKDIWSFELEHGRFFTEGESASGRNLAILGYDISENLFRGENPVGKSIKVYGRKMTVIGVFEKEGSSMVGNSMDELVVVPVLYLDRLMDIDNERMDPLIMVRAYDEIPVEQLKAELRGVMRSIRRLQPKADDNFSLNEISVVSQGLTNMFNIIGTAGWIIGGFAILVGGFGIANIMFVSVKERTTIIGIQKSLGAKNFFILFQFLFEAIIHSLVGGTIGLLIVFALSLMAARSMDFAITMSMGNVMTGISISVFIGVVSGLAPAISASRLDPVEAIRTGQ